MNKDLTPCPYHKPGAQPCGKEKLCPLLHSSEYVFCNALSPHDIAFVKAAILGRAVGREES